MPNYFIKIFVAGPFLSPLTYRADTEIQAGIRVRVPLGSREVIGLTEGPDTHNKLPDRCKPVMEVLDDSPILTKDDFSLLAFAANYYHSPVGSVVMSSLPTSIRRGKKIPKGKITLGLNEPHAYELTKQQVQVINRVRAIHYKFSCFLLQGVTGSGKTRIFIELIRSTIQKKKQVLLLIPEIGLSGQMEARIRETLNGTLTTYHSGLADGARASAFVAASSGQAQVLIGTRSSLFTPMPNLGLILVDEEHDGAYKNQNGMRYSARDLAIVRAKYLEIPVVLSSATPSMESWLAAESKRYVKLELTERPNRKPHPKLIVIDTRREKPDSGLTHTVRLAIQQTIERGEQALIFLNRRGYAPVNMCTNCGFLPKCPHCDATPTLHRQPEILWCHHCDTKRYPAKCCPSCGSENMLPIGNGTERLEEYLISHFPNVPIIRVDRDTTTRRYSFKRLLEPVVAGDPCILLGTQMLAKGHDFKNLTTVVVSDADQGLLGADFRSIEHFSQLMTQVSGRAGRRNRLGQVFIQTHRPESPWLEQIIDHNYDALATQILAERNQFGWPPYTHLALITGRALQSDKVFLALNDIRQHFEQLKSPLRLMGPAPAPMERRNRWYHGQLLVAGTRSLIQWALKETGPWAYKKQGKVIFQLDVDPWDLW